MRFCFRFGNLYPPMSSGFFYSVVEFQQGWTAPFTFNCVHGPSFLQVEQAVYFLLRVAELHSLSLGRNEVIETTQRVPKFLQSS